MWKLDALSGLLCIATGIFVGLSLDGATEFGGWLSQWQTLVAGALAVGAAAVTVLQMERTDIRQQTRHIELVRLGLRADRLTMLRLRDVWLDRLVAQADAIIPSLATIDQATKTTNDYSPIELNKAMGAFGYSFWRFKEILEDPLYEAAKPLFDGPATTAARFSDQSIQAIRELNGPLSAFLNFNQGPAFGYYADAAETVEKYWGLARGVPAAVQRLAAEIRRIAALYE